MANKIEKAVWELTEELISDLGYETADVEFMREKDGMYLRIYIYSPDGIGIDDCVAVHRKVEPVIDDKAEIDGSYTLEISSPGYDRKFKYPADYNRYMGQAVELRLYKSLDGVKVWSGTLAGYGNGVITLATEDKEMQFNESEVASVKRKFVI